MAGKTSTNILAFVWISAAIGLCLLAPGVIVLRLLPFDSFFQIARAATHTTRPITPEQYAILVPRLLPTGLFYGLLGLLMLVKRRTLTTVLADACASAREVLADYSKAARLALSDGDRFHWCAVALVIAGGIALRLMYINEPPRYDESDTFVEYAGRSIFHAITLYMAPNNHVFHSVLVWISCRIFGSSMPAIRLPALVAGIALMPLVYVFARRVSGKTEALFATALVAVSGPLILYSVNGRGYTLQAALLMWMLILAIDLASESVDDDRRSIGLWLLFTFTAIAGFWTIPTMLYGYVAIALWIFWNAGFRALKPLIGSSVLAALGATFLYVPILVVSGPQALLANRWVRALPADSLWILTGAFPQRLFHFLYAGDPFALPLAVGCGLLVSLVLFRGRSGSSIRLLVSTVAAVVLLSSIRGIVPYPRVLLPAIPIVCIVAASGWSVLARAFRGLEPAVSGIVLLLLAACAIRFTRSGYIQSTQEFSDSPVEARYLAKELRTCDRLFISLSAAMPLIYELQRFNVNYEEFQTSTTKGSRLLIACGPSERPPELNSELRNPEYLTLAGSLIEAKVPAAEYTSPRLIFQQGNARVYEMNRLPAADDATNPATRNCPATARPSP